MLDVSGSMSFPSTAAEQARLMAVNPDNLLGNPGYSAGLPVCLPLFRAGRLRRKPEIRSIRVQSPPWANHSNPSPGRILPGVPHLAAGDDADVVCAPAPTTAPMANSVNWNATPVTSCPTPGTTSCIQLRADAVGYAVKTLLSTAAAAEQVTNQYQVGLFPFIQYLYGCTSVTPCSASNAYVPLTTNLTGVRSPMPPPTLPACSTPAPIQTSARAAPISRTRSPA